MMARCWMLDAGGLRVRSIAAAGEGLYLAVFSYYCLAALEKNMPLGRASSGSPK
ncbi:hypothetical protein BS50DRAFT_577164, partial [Corynespora cassiicola Philippines]